MININIEETTIKCPYQTGRFPNTYGTIDIKLPLDVSFVPKEDLTAYELAILLGLHGMIFYSEEEVDNWLSNHNMTLAKRHLVIRAA